MIEGFANPAASADRMQIAQEVALPPIKTDLAWADAYQARFRDPRLRNWLIAADPCLTCDWVYT